MDCIGKLFTYAYFQDPEPPEVDSESGITPPPTIPLVDRVAASICETFKTEDIDARVELQIIKALLAAVINDKLFVHGKILLNSIRKIYFISVRSLSQANQGVAQAALTQMVDKVFERVKKFINLSTRSNKSSSLDVSSLRNGSVASTTSAGEESTPELTLRSMTQKTTSQRHSIEDDRIAKDESLELNVDDAGADSNDLMIKDAFLVFRTMCMLTEKPLEDDGTNLKSQAVRTKLLTLHLVHTILKTHMSVFTCNNLYIKSSNKGDEKFVIAIKDYVCSMLARNAASISSPVFEISAEILWLIWSNLRSQFKKEISVFLVEIYFPILEMKTSTVHQKQYFLSILQRVCNDPRALVEIYLNYDCDRNAPVNVFEHIIDVLVKMAVTPVHMTQMQLQNYYEAKTKHQVLATYNLSLPPALAIASLAGQSHVEASAQYPMEYSLKMVALDSLVAVLRSLLTWSQRGIAAALTTNSTSHDALSELNGAVGDSNVDLDETPSGAATPNLSNGKGFSDDPSQFESLKHRKAALSGAVREFNFKPKRGLERLIREGFISSKEPIEVAKFLLNTEGLDKATIGDFLGDDDPYHISIMHEFVDLMDFKGLSFVDALRRFLQGFRLPGEAQKIDRYMLKFAERYISDNPGVFSNADTPYILAYSVIMLNTDLHSPEIKQRMTTEEFIRNNRGINDSANLPDEFLLNIYHEIQTNEIKLLSEQHAALLSSGGTQGGSFAANFGLTLAAVGRDLQREAYMQASKEMSSKTEQLFKRLISSEDGRNKDNEFYIASHIEHVKPMFEFAWMSCLAGLSGPFQESEEADVVRLCMEGLRLAIRIACLFDVELARISFVSALANFTNLQSLSEMKLKNVEAVKVLLTTALSEGNMLKSSWKDVLTCISQLERFQLIASGIEAKSIPDVTNARFASRESVDRVRSFGSPANFRAAVFNPEVGRELQSSTIEVDMDKIFTQSSQLSGDGIVEFVKALTAVSSEEIQSSGNSDHPRMFSLQKMVDVSYYNMERIRVEWSQLWVIMGDQFNKMGSHENANVVSFALDSLRQLSLRFFDLEELSHFKFQKDFLKPFEYTMVHNNDKAAKELVLECLQQMILAKSDRIKSGWSAMFGVFSKASNVEYGM
ncbi:Arf family guanine nucleotide exchange factor SEC7 [Sugiyamaella lignohabitans]|uniref:Arf family guanine nucleotide exchange factor SEC7 n=1 Tax=Sugiyamaella lignohabitans TaxID=796027 RepID=A0A167F5J2_9ASCO|nr:Arf family guanine nucleotide exchange factor SEC7 [Sugiyamaella lignohabitans]ANB14854.1 Arf family guanine nucleotide exchange factor SEC7 [Sugiyamaella lignohabitans]